MSFSCSQASNVRFSRMIATILTLTYVLFQARWALYLVLIFSLSTLLLGSHRNLSQWVLRALHALKLTRLTQMDAAVGVSYTLNRSMELFEESMRSGFIVLLILLDGWHYETAASIMAFVIMIMMLISTLFRFCMSGVFYILFQKITHRS